MKTRLGALLTAAITVLTFVVLVAPSGASARTYRSTHDGVAVAMPAHAVASAAGTAKIVSRVWPVRHRTVKSHMTRVYQNGTLVKRAPAPYLRPGSYHISVRVLYRRWTWVTRHGQRVKSYGRLRAFATGAHSLVVKPHPVHHACTRTSSGTCIQGGEFCPQADYGMTGYDAYGQAWVCTGDRTHPHWE